MSEIFNNYLTALNNIGRSFCDYAGEMFIQSIILIILLLLIDVLIRTRVRTTFRYCMWMLVLIKLVLPPSLSLPTGIGYWRGDLLSVQSSGSPQMSMLNELDIKQNESIVASQSETIISPIQVNQIESDNINPESTTEKLAVTPVQIHNTNLVPVTWQGIIFVLWLIGVIVLSVLLIQRITFVRRIVGQSEPVLKELNELMDQCRKKLWITRKIEIRSIANIQSPAICGLFRPVILIPETLLIKLPREKLRMVLIHELAHLKRGDLWGNCVQTLLQIVYFYNPFVWLSNLIIRRIREQVVDEMVLVALGAEAKSYSNTLIDIAEMAFFKTSLSLRLIGVVESKKALKNRIKHMLSRPVPANSKLGLLGSLVIFIIAAVLLPMAKGQKTESNVVQDRREDNPFKVTLTNSETVELLGICEHPSAGKQWWRPDGSLVDGDGFGDYEYNNHYYIPEDNEYTRIFAIKLSGGDLDDINLSWNFNKADRSSFNPCYIDQDRKKPEQAIIAKFSKDVRFEDLTICIATGDWKTVAFGANGRTTAGTNDSITNRSVIFHEASNKDGYLKLSATHLLGSGYDCRMIIYDNQERLHKPIKRSNSGSDMRLCEGYFDEIPRGQIKCVALQARPYDGVTFKNVSLQPGVKTDVKVEAADYNENPLFQSGYNEKVIGIIKDGNGKIGEITAEYGDAVYGNNIKYTPSLYLGRVRKGDKVQLMYSNVIQNQYGIPMIKMKTISSSPGLAVNTIGWIELKNTSFKDQFVASENISLQSGIKTDVKSQIIPDKKIDYSSVVVTEGFGFDDIIVGESYCTGEYVKSRLGKPDEEVKDEKTGWWLDYTKTYGLDFWVNLKEDILLEIRLNKGFKGKLFSGISLSSTKQDVFDTYGRPLEENIVDDLTKHFDDQVLYQVKSRNPFSKATSGKIFYRQQGLLFWFEGDKILQIVIHHKDVKTNMQVGMEKANIMAEQEDSQKKTDLTKPAGYWNFDGSANDIAGNKNGVVRGAILTEGISGQAYYFDGDDDYIEIEDITLGTFSFSAWIKSETGSLNNRRIFLLNQGDKYYGLQGSTGRGLSFCIAGGGEDGIDELKEYDWEFEPDKWTHIVVTFNGSAGKIYKDGKLTETGQISEGLLMGTLYIGGTTAHRGAIWHGALDEVAIFNSVLSDEDVDRLYNMIRPSVSLVVGSEKMTFEGKDVTWEQLPEILEKIPNRSRTVFCIAVASDQITLGQLNQAKDKAGILSRQYGFEYLSYVGIHPLDSKADEKQVNK